MGDGRARRCDANSKVIVVTAVVANSSGPGVGLTVLAYLQAENRAGAQKQNRDQLAA